ncbi:MAG: fibronectin type III domain-containing protein [Acidimicrobiia bacterium]
MTKRFGKPTVFLATVLALLVGASAAIAARSSGSSTPESGTVEFSDSRLKVEINATDGDAGLQPFIDGDPWKKVRIINPEGDVIFKAQPEGKVKNYGLTELFSESSEPPFTEFPLEKFQRLFPEGKYRFRGRTIDGQKMVGAAKLTHDFPDGPVITSPTADQVVPAGSLLVQWNDVTTPAGIVIDGYQVLVVREDPLRVFNVDLPPTANSVTVPSEYFEPGTQYKVEVLAIEVSGNQTLTELDFATAP